MDVAWPTQRLPLHLILFDSAVHGLEKLRRYKISALGSHGLSILRINNYSYPSRIASIRSTYIDDVNLYVKKIKVYKKRIAKLDVEADTKCVRLGMT